MKITDIQKAKSTRYTVFVDDEYFAVLDIEIIYFNGLKVGDEIDEEHMQDILRQAQRRTARERAYYLLGYRDHSKKELYDKLLKSACPEIALEIVEMVEEQGLINDAEYARKLAEYYLKSKAWGEKKVYFEMLRRGIDKETASEALSCCEVDSVGQIKAVIEKKYYDCLEDYNKKQRTIAALLRKGFSYEDIKSAMELIAEE